jgi:exonuclease VII small subunit
MIQAPARGVPSTYDRAATELVRCRRRLVSARESLELAIGIFRRLDDATAQAKASFLESLIGDLEQAEAALRTVND